MMLKKMQYPFEHADVQPFHPQAVAVEQSKTCMTILEPIGSEEM